MSGKRSTLTSRKFAPGYFELFYRGQISAFERNRYLLSGKFYKITLLIYNPVNSVMKSKVFGLRFDNLSSKIRFRPLSVPILKAEKFWIFHEILTGRCCNWPNPQIISETIRGDIISSDFPRSLELFRFLRRMEMYFKNFNLLFLINFEEVLNCSKNFYQTIFHRQNDTREIHTVLCSYCLFSLRFLTIFDLKTKSQLLH